MSMKAHKLSGPGKLKPLASRLSKEDMVKRMAKTEVRARMSREHAITRGMAAACLMVLQRGFFGKLKWLFFGR